MIKNQDRQANDLIYYVPSIPNINRQPRTALKKAILLEITLGDDGVFNKLINRLEISLKSKSKNKNKDINNNINKPDKDETVLILAMPKPSSSGSNSGKGKPKGTKNKVYMPNPKFNKETWLKT